MSKHKLQYFYLKRAIDQLEKEEKWNIHHYWNNIDGESNETPIEWLRSILKELN